MAAFAVSDSLSERAVSSRNIASNNQYDARVWIDDWFRIVNDVIENINEYMMNAINCKRSNQFTLLRSLQRI